MRVLTAEQARQRVEGLLGGDPASEAGQLEALRLELLAAGSLPGHQLLARAGRRLWLDEGEAQGLAGALERLVQAGDAAAGPGGIVAATPVRLVELGRQRHALLGTVGTRRASELAPGASFERGSPRRLLGLAPEAAAALARALGGQVLTLARWSGLDRAPTLRAWQDRQEKWLSGARAGDLVELAERGAVERLAVVAQGGAARPRWEAGGLRAGALARVRRPEGDEYGLLVSDDERAPAVPLTRDEAARAGWEQLSRGGGARLEAERTAGGRQRVSWPMWLPRAEWRALWLLDRASEPERGPAVVVDDEDLGWLAGVLSERLGAALHVVDGGAEMSRESPENQENS